jgi:predicted Zn-dependent peptidase
MRSTLLLSGLLLGANGLVWAQTPKVQYVEFDLANGLHVILHEDHSTPIVAVTVMYHVGSKNESTERTGMAHFFEHLLFEGSQHIDRGEFDSYVEGAGGALNANTTQDRTFYYELLPSNQLELGLWLESERMLHAKIEPIGIETQREVVKEEKRQRYDNQPYGMLLPKTMEAAYREHPYRWTPIGSMDHLNAASFEEFMEFYRTFYVPNNAVLSIAGDLDPAKTRKLIEKYFNDIPRGTRPIPRPEIREPRRSGEVRDTVFGKDALPMVVQAYPIPEQGSDDFYAVAVLNQLLSGGESSRLNKRVVDADQTALYCGAFNFSLEDPGLTLAYALVNMGVDPKTVETAINDEVQRLQTTAVDERELQKVKNQIETEFVTANSSVAGIAESLANYHMYFGDAELINTEVDRYLAVTPADIQRVAKTYYTPEQRVTLYFLQQPAQP